MALSRKRQAFVEAYLKHWNATKAAEEANYAFPRRQGSRLLSNVDIQAEIQRRLDEMKLDADEVLRRLGEQARADYSEYLKVDEEGKTFGVDLERLIADGKGHLIKGFRHSKYGLVVEFYDAQSALALLGRHHQLFTDKVDVTSKGESVATAVSGMGALVALYDALTADRVAPGDAPGNGRTVASPPGTTE